MYPFGCSVCQMLLMGALRQSPRDKVYRFAAVIPFRLRIISLLKWFSINIKNSQQTRSTSSPLNLKQINVLFSICSKHSFSFTMAWQTLPILSSLKLSLFPGSKHSDSHRRNKYEILPYPFLQESFYSNTFRTAGKRSISSMLVNTFLSMIGLICRSSSGVKLVKSYHQRSVIPSSSK